MLLVFANIVLALLIAAALPRTSKAGGGAALPPPPYASDVGPVVVYNTGGSLNKLAWAAWAAAHFKLLM